MAIVFKVILFVTACFTVYLMVIVFGGILSVTVCFTVYLLVIVFGGILSVMVCFRFNYTGYGILINILIRLYVIVFHVNQYIFLHHYIHTTLRIENHP